MVTGEDRSRSHDLQMVIAAAVGDNVFRRMPVTSDMILMALEAHRPMHEPLTANI